MVRCSLISVLVGLLAGVGCADGVGNSIDDVADESGDDVIGDSADDSTDDSSGDSIGDTDEESGDGSSEEEPEPPALVSIAVETTPVYRPTQGAWPDAAFGGTQYLVVWEDHRLRRPILYGARVTADGTALDPFGFRILDAHPQAAIQQVYQPAVAFDGENFLVISAVGVQIHGVRVSPAGEVLDPGGFVIWTGSWASPPSVVFDGQQYLVAWSGYSYLDSGVFRARVLPDGTVPNDTVMVHEADGMGPMSASFDGTHALLSWVSDWNHGTRLLYAGRIAADGTLIDDPPMLLSNAGDYVIHHAAGFDGTNYVIAWSSTQNEIRASRVTPDGTLLDPNGLVVADLEGAPWGRVDIAAGGGRSIVVWSTSDFCEEWYYCTQPVRAAQITTDGTTSSYPDDTFGIGIEPMVEAHPDGALLLWRDGQDLWLGDGMPIVGKRLDAAGVPVGSEVEPASTASRQDVKAVASDGQDFFVLWSDTRGPTRAALHGARVGADGTPLDLESLELTPGLVEWVDVVFDGANYVVTWLNLLDEQFNTVRVSPAGVRLDENPLHPPLSGYVAGASDGTHTLLVGRANPQGYSALLLDQDGAVASEIITIPGTGYAQAPAAASFDGAGYLVVWDDYGQNRMLGQRVTLAGALEGQPISIVEYDPEIGIHQQHELAGGDGIHLLIWETEDGVWATRVTSDGQVLDPDGLAVGGSGHYQIYNNLSQPDLTLCSEASVVFDGENFVVAWRDRSIQGENNSMDLHAATVSPEGIVSPHFLISQEPEREGAPFLAANGEGQVLAAYNRFVPGPPYDARRAVATLLP
jgi:hypothetical protein